MFQAINSTITEMSESCVVEGATYSKYVWHDGQESWFHMAYTIGCTPNEEICRVVMTPDISALVEIVRGLNIKVQEIKLMSSGTTNGTGSWQLVSIQAIFEAKANGCCYYAYQLNGQIFLNEHLDENVDLTSSGYTKVWG